MQSDVSQLKEKANAGDSDAAFAIFKLYEESKTDVAEAWDVARHYLMMATEKENPDALLAMGRLLIAGIKMDKDVEKGMALLRQAKDLGNKDVDDVASELDIALDVEPDVELGDTDSETIRLDTENMDADDEDDSQSIDNPGKSDDVDADDKQPAPMPEKAEKKYKKQADLGKPDGAVTADQLMRMIKTKLSKLEKIEMMSAAHHFDIIKIAIDDSENIKELQAIYGALDNLAYVETLHKQSCPIIGWNPKQGIFYLDTGGHDDADSDEAPLPKRSYQRGEVRNLIFAVFITIVVLIIFLNLLYAVRPL
jgi:TPR repeat protein